MTCKCTLCDHCPNDINKYVYINICNSCDHGNHPKLRDQLPDIIPNNDDHSLVTDMQDSFNPLTGFNLNTIDLNELEKDTEIILIAKDGAKFGICTEKFKVVKNEKGDLNITPVGDKDDEAKELIAEFLVSVHEKEIKNSVKAMVKKALKRKPISVLNKLVGETKKKKRSKLETRRGCVYFQIGDEAIIL